MGFLSSFIKTVVGIGRAVIGLPPAAAATVAKVATRPVIAAVGGAAAAAGRTIIIGGKKFVQAASGQFFPIAAGATAGALAAGVVTPGGPIPAPPGTAIAMGTPGIGGGNGQFVKQTIVQTLLVATGEVVRSEVFQGAPFAMQKDINRIRTLDRKLTRAANRVRSKSRGPSKQKQLTDAVVDTALRGVLTSCPPKC